VPSPRRARLVLLDGVEPERELGVCGALLAETGDPDGAVVAARLRGSALALGRWQPGRAGALRRWTGGRATHFGDGVLCLGAIAPEPQAWLDERAQLPGPRLLNRWARGLLAGLGAMGVQAAYPGRDFATANGRQVAMLGLERTRSGRLLFHAVIGATRAHPAEPDPEFPGLPPYPQTSSIEAEGGDPSQLRALARGLVQRFGLDAVESAAPEPGPLPSDPTPPGVCGPAVRIPIGRLCAALELSPDGCIARARLLGDWIAASSDLEALETALAGAEPSDAALEALAARWLARPGAIAIGVTDPRQIAGALRAALAP
jgi:hypothetical protein